MTFVENRATIYLSYAVLCVGAFIALFPIALLIVNSLKPAAEIVINPLSFPWPIKWENFSNAWRDAHFSHTLLNSVIISATTIVLVCSTGSLSAYVIARRKIGTWKLWSMYLLAT